MNVFQDLPAWEDALQILGNAFMTFPISNRDSKKYTSSVAHSDPSSLENGPDASEPCLGIR